MLGLKRRRRVEGWAVDAAETNSDVGRATLMQRLAQNNRLWIICAIVIVIASLYLVVLSGRSGDNASHSKVVARAQDSYMDEEHQAFADALPTKPHLKGKLVRARFSDADMFEITLKSGTSLEDVGYAARIVGTQIARRFGYRPVVLAYVTGPGGSRSAEPVLTATYDLKSSGYVSTPTRPNTPTN